MVFNSETNGLDLYSDARYESGLDETSDTTSYPIKAFTRNANKALDRVHALILRADNIWEFDDSNQTGELLDVSTNLANGTSKYALSLTWLKIGRVRVKDQAGNWVTLSPRNRAQQVDVTLNQTSGTPREYDLLGNYLYVLPAPNYISAGGMEVQFQRGPSYYVYTDTTKTPGFASHFHTYVSLFAAWRYCKVNGMLERASELKNDLIEMESEIQSHYATRDADAKVTLTTQREDFGQLGLNPGSGPYSGGSSTGRSW